MLRNEHKDVKVPFGASNYSELVYSFPEARNIDIQLFCISLGLLSGSSVLFPS